MLTEQDIRDALKACFDASNPYQRPLNLVDLGMVESIVLTVDREAPGFGIAGLPPRQSLVLELIPCSDDAADEDANAMLLAQVENRLAGLPELSRTAVRFLPEPRWTPERIAPGLRHILKLDPPAFPILNNRLR